MPALTFPEFQASRAYVEDLQVTIGFTDDRPPQAGYVYADESCYIECTDENTFYLLIERSDWVDTDLAKLERILWSQHYLSEVAGDSEVILKKDDSTLDDYVLGACDARGIECDGDHFGIVFSGKDSWPLSEAAALVAK